MSFTVSLIPIFWGVLTKVVYIVNRFNYCRKKIFWISRLNAFFDNPFSDIRLEESAKCYVAIYHILLDFGYHLHFYFVVSNKELEPDRSHRRRSAVPFHRPPFAPQPIVFIAWGADMP